MATTHKHAARAAPAKKTTGKKAGAWLVTATEAKTTPDGRTRRLLKDEERPTPPGSTFHFEVSGGHGQVVMATVIPTATSRDGLFSLPPNLKRQVQDATGGVRWTSALMALADYAVDVLEQTPGAVTISPDSNAAGEGPVCSRLHVAPAKKLSITLEAPLPAWDKETRRRISVPQDIRARINGLIDKGSFTGVALGLAQFALEHLRKNKKRLLVLPANVD